MSDLRLISLNNTIVGLRKPIAKAEVHIIHKLTRQVKHINHNYPYLTSMKQIENPELSNLYSFSFYGLGKNFERQKDIRY